MDRKRKRVFHRERKSPKWSKLNKLFKKAVKSAKHYFYKNKIADLKISKPSQWYSTLKRLTGSYDNEIIVDQISHLSNQQQSEEIAREFSDIQNGFYCPNLRPINQL